MWNHPHPPTPPTHTRARTHTYTHTHKPHIQTIYTVRARTYHTRTHVAHCDVLPVGRGPTTPRDRRIQRFGLIVSVCASSHQTTTHAHITHHTPHTKHTTHTHTHTHTHTLHTHTLHYTPHTTVHSIPVFLLHTSYRLFRSFFVLCFFLLREIKQPTQYASLVCVLDPSSPRLLVRTVTARDPPCPGRLQWHQHVINLQDRWISPLLANRFVWQALTRVAMGCGCNSVEL